MDKILEKNSSCLEADVALAKAGDKHALEAVIRGVQQDVYAVAIRFLWHPQDAEDATQEILIKVITSLSSFRGESEFKTWVYKISANTLLTLKKKRMERESMTFDEFAEDLYQDQSGGLMRTESDVDEKLLLEEVKIGCTLAMLMCLDRKHRLAYILGDIIELGHSEASQVLDTTQATYRKRLSRARKSIISFMLSHCGLVEPENGCRCRKRVDTAINLGRVDPDNPIFAYSLEKAKHFPRILKDIRKLEDTQRVAALYRSHPVPIPDHTFAKWLREELAEIDN